MLRLFIAENLSLYGMCKPVLRCVGINVMSLICRNGRSKCRFHLQSSHIYSCPDILLYMNSCLLTKIVGPWDPRSYIMLCHSHLLIHLHALTVNFLYIRKSLTFMSILYEVSPETHEMFEISRWQRTYYPLLTRLSGTAILISGAWLTSGIFDKFHRRSEIRHTNVGRISDLGRNL